MEQLTLLSKNDIQEMVDAAVEKAMRMNVPKPIKKLNLDLPEAIEYLNSIGYKCGRSSLYKLSRKDLIPFSKFGKRILFNAEDLNKWVETKKKKTISI